MLCSSLFSGKQSCLGRQGDGGDEGGVGSPSSPPACSGCETLGVKQSNGFNILLNMLNWLPQQISFKGKDPKGVAFPPGHSPDKSSALSCKLHTRIHMANAHTRVHTGAKAAHTHAYTWQRHTYMCAHGCLSSSHTAKTHTYTQVHTGA